MTTGTRRVERALISVSDKRGIEGFARTLASMGVEILATGGTRALLEAGGIAAREVAEVTGFPEMMDGRVKTLHPRVHGGILARRDDPAHLRAMREHEIPAIDLVVINLYPFEETIAKDGGTREQAIEQIDIGGPAMVRSAAKNHEFVAVVTDPDDYGRVQDELQTHGALRAEMRRELARKAFALTASYDAAVSRWMLGLDPARDAWPERYSIAGRLAFELRYGENPHQEGAFYRTSDTREPSVGRAEVLHGKELSFNNLVDLDSALALAKEFHDPFVCVVKHSNPCGSASAPTIAQALADAWAGDPLSAFGSVLAFNRPVDAASARFLVAENRFVEAIIAPELDADAFALLRDGPKWGKNVRLLACGSFSPQSRIAAELEMRHLTGGFLLQRRDLQAAEAQDLQVVTKTAPDEAQRRSLLFAERIAKHVKSNAIVLARGTRVVGVGAGQMSRVDSVRMAAHKAGAQARGAVLASDAFFPFSDGVELAIESGATAILQPGGSIRDKDVIAACDARGVPMVFTGKRHFRH